MESEGQGRRPPAPVPVRVCPADIRLAIDFAREYVRAKQHAGKPGWRGGLLPGLVVRGGERVEKDIAGTVIGKVAEIAMCRLAGVEPDLAIRRGGDGGRDLPLPCGKVQVKASMKGRNLVRVNAEQVPWFVFAKWDGVSANVEILGYLSRQRVIEFAPVKSHLGNWLNHEIPCSSLLPIRSLLRIRPIDEVL